MSQDGITVHREWGTISGWKGSQAWWIIEYPKGRDFYLDCLWCKGLILWWIYLRIEFLQVVQSSSKNCMYKDNNFYFLHPQKNDGCLKSTLRMILLIFVYAYSAHHFYFDKTLCMIWKRHTLSQHNTHSKSCNSFGLLSPNKYKSNEVL